jgi:hypothetical protein
MPPESRQAVEAWAQDQDDKPSFSEAIRRLVEQALAAAPKRGAGKIDAPCRAGSRASPSLIEGNFNFAARPVGCEYQVDGAPEFMRDEIADEA